MEALVKMWPRVAFLLQSRRLHSQVILVRILFKKKVQENLQIWDHFKKNNIAQLDLLSAVLLLNDVGSRIDKKCFFPNAEKYT